MNKQRHIFIGVAWPYVNGDLHIGHLAGYLLPADICARYHRLVGDKILMASGSDCFGTPITVEADKRQLKPKQIADEYHAKDVRLFTEILGLSYDIYTRTDMQHHAEVVQDFFLKLLEGDYIFIEITEQYFSPSEKRFLPDRYVVGTCPYCNFADARSDQCDNCGELLDHGEIVNPRSNLSGETVELKETEHYFLDWPKLQPKLEKYVRRVGKSWKNWVYQGTLGWLNEGLKSRAISRDIDWGVPLPVDRIPLDKRIKDIDQKRLYVWFDAVIGYFSASKLWSSESGSDWRSFWYGNNLKHYYFMGKDNLIFHTLFWPGKLMVYDIDLHLPDMPSINMFLNLEGKQFSKSRGVSIGINDIVEKFGNDRVRFYLTLIMPETRDSSFSWEDFQEKVNAVLVGNIGNFIHRTLSIGQGIESEKISVGKLTPQTAKEIKRAFSRARKTLENCEFKNYLESVATLANYGNKLFDYEQVWSLKKNDQAKYVLVLKQLYMIILALGYLLMPLLPESTEKLFRMLGIKNVKEWPLPKTEMEYLMAQLSEIDTSLKPTPLFQKIEELDLPPTH